MKARSSSLYWYIALIVLVLVAVALAWGPSTSAGIWESPISPVETPQPLPTHPGVPAGFTPTPTATTAPTPGPVPTKTVRGTPEPAPTMTLVILLPETGAEQEAGHAVR